MTVDEIMIEELGASRLDELEPLWNALREHHLSVAPDWLPAPLPRESSWHRRRTQYEGWLAEEDAFVLVARRGVAAVGYAFVHLRGGSPTWQLADRAGEVETLSVLPAERGRGTGRLLLDAVCARLHRLGATEVSLHLLCGNEDAERFYEREGFEPFAVWLTRPLARPN